MGGMSDIKNREWEIRATKLRKTHNFNPGGFHMKFMIMKMF